jgi:hypothetical protein
MKMDGYMTTRDLTTVQISKEASDQLTALAMLFKRSKAAHAEWIIERDYKQYINPDSIDDNGKNGQSKGKAKM